MDQLHVLLSRLDELYGALAALLNAVAGAVMVVLLVLAVYRYVAGSHKVAALYEDALAAAAAGLSLGFAAGVLNGGLFPMGAWPYQLAGVLLALATLKHLRK